MITTEPKTMQLPVKLNEEETRQKGEELAKVVSEVNKLEQEKKDSASYFKTKIEEKEKLRDKLSYEVNTRTENREVQVFEEMSYSDGLARTIRKDTMEQVTTRPLSKEEVQKYRQEELNLELVAKRSE